MKSELGKKLQWLGQRQRNRIWLNRVMRRSVPIFVYCALVFSLAGGIHQLMLPLKFPLIAGLAILPSLLYLGFLCVTQKPTQQQGAAAADQVFAANSLFVSAWELTRFEADIKGAGKLLLDRCEQALPAWSRPVRQAPRGSLKPSGLITITLTMFGLFFLWQPSHVQLQLDSPAAANPRLEVASEDSAEAARILSELLDNRLPPATQAPEQPVNQAAPADPSVSAVVRGSDQPDQSAETETVELAATADKRGPLAVSKAAAISLAGTPRASEKTADHGAGNEAAEAPDSSVIETAEYDQIQLVNIETGSDHRSIASDGSSQGNELLESKPGQAALRQSASKSWQQISANGSAYMLSPQQRNLVWRYFVQLDKIDGPRE